MARMASSRRSTASPRTLDAPAADASGEALLAFWGQGFERLPWLESLWQRWNDARTRDRVAQATLLIGPSGIGKALLLRAWVAARRCEQPGADRWPCGRCPACRRLQVGNDADVATLLPSGAQREHGIDAVRGAARFLALTAQGDGRVLLIDAAERLNRNAANALLKTLEEPPAGAEILMTSSAPQRLPATILSRCRKETLVAPDREVLRSWWRDIDSPAIELDEALIAALDEPLAARALAGDADALQRWSAERETLQVLLAPDRSLAEIVRVCKRCDAARLTRHVQALIVAAIRGEVADRVDPLATLLGAGALADWAAAHGRDALFALLDRSFVWRREADVPLNADLRWEAIALALRPGMRAATR